MLANTKAIVLKTTKYSETSVISKIFTESFGLQTYLVQGVRSAKAKGKASLLQPFSLLDLVAYQRENKNLQRLREFRYAHIYQTVPFDVVKRSIAIFITEVLSHSIKEEGEEHPELFNFLFQSFIDLDQLEEGVANYHLHVLIELATLLGFEPKGTHSEATPLFDLQDGSFCSTYPQHPVFLEAETSILFSKLIHSENRGAIKMSANERKTIMHQLVRYFKLHVHNFGDLNSPDILEVVLRT